MTATELLCRINRVGAYGYDAGRELIIDAGGELVAIRRGLNGAAIETWRVRFPDRDVLLTWGLGGVRDPRFGTLPEEWRIVQDKVR
jgi:hypothetical protein